MKTFEQLEEDVIFWAEQVGIFDDPQVERQVDKLSEEVGEFLSALGEKDFKHAEEELGDVLVVLMVISKLCGFNITNSLSQVYRKISARRGKMINGLFVKFEDLPEEEQKKFPPLQETQRNPYRHTVTIRRDIEQQIPNEPYDPPVAVDEAHEPPTAADGLQAHRPPPQYQLTLDEYEYLRGFRLVMRDEEAISVNHASLPYSVEYIRTNHLAYVPGDRYSEGKFLSENQFIDHHGFVNGFFDRHLKIRKPSHVEFLNEAVTSRTRMGSFNTRNPAGGR